LQICPTTGEHFLIEIKVACHVDVSGEWISEGVGDLPYYVTGAEERLDDLWRRVSRAVALAG